MEKNDFIINLQKYDTKDTVDDHINGTLSVIYRDYDKIIDDKIQMIYVSSVFPNEKKGPHLHTKRNSYFTCVHGKVIFIIKDNDGNYHEIESSADEPIIIKVPKGIPSAHVNISNDISRVLTLADVSWRPNDNEMENILFDDYDWKKLK